MPNTSDCKRYRQAIINHFVRKRGQLSAKAKTHFAWCEACIAVLSDLCRPAALKRMASMPDFSDPRVLSRQSPAFRRAWKEFGDFLEQQYGRSLFADPEQPNSDKPSR